MNLDEFPALFWQINFKLDPHVQKIEIKFNHSEFRSFYTSKCKLLVRGIPCCFKAFRAPWRLKINRPLFHLIYNLCLWKSAYTICFVEKEALENKEESLFARHFSCFNICIAELGLFNTTSGNALESSNYLFSCVKSTFRRCFNCMSQFSDR